MAEPLSISEIAKHSSSRSCWIVLYNRVWDVTDFLQDHPGGANILLRNGGKDATADYEMYHPPELVEDMLPPTACLGQAEPSPVSTTEDKTTEDQQKSKSQELVPLGALLNLDDFERAAEKNLTPNAWAYYSSAADDELAKEYNRRAYQKILMRPRVLRDVDTIQTKTTILGQPCSMPVFVSPAAMAKLAHPDGECAIAAAAGHEGIIQVISTSSSMPMEKIMEARPFADQPIFFQLYVHRDQSKSEALIRRAEKVGAKAIWVTVDSPVMGKRERDERVKGVLQSSEESGVLREGQEVKGIARTMGAIITPKLTWKHLEWIRSKTSLPLVLKGIQSVEDAVLAYQHGVQGIVLSNHGGRSQDTAQPSILTLLEIRKYAPFLLASGMEIYLDGGIRRGSDVVKAIALGATAVGIGRPVLYSLAGHGERGAKHMLAILRDEIMTNMALAGACNVSEIRPEMVNTSRLERDLTARVKL